MNGYTLIERMRKIRNWHELNPYAQLLYHELVAVCNNKRWKEVFPCSNIRLCRTLNFSEKTLLRARKALVDAGLILYQSGKHNRQEGLYSFIIPTNLDNMQNPVNIKNTDPDTNTVSDPDVNTVPNPDNKKDIYINNKTLSNSLKKDVSVCEKETWIFFDKDKIKNNLLADRTWKERAAKQSGMGTEFMAILPAQIDVFLGYIIATGDEETIRTLSDAKRRFFWWWKIHGSKAYNIQSEINGLWSGRPFW